jgi:hypothetical protein
VPTAKTEPATWHYTVKKPSANWTAPNFDARGWAEGVASFGTEGTPGAYLHTRWDTDDIWLRRDVTLPDGKFHNLRFYVDHDEDVEIYVNGVLASSEVSFVSSYVPLEISPAALELLKPGATVTVAVHCHQTEGGQNIDVGLVDFVK